MTVEQIENTNNKKVDRYIKLLSNSRLLANSSQSIIRKKKSRLARKIKKGDIKAIKSAAKSKFFGSLTKKQQSDICKLLCDFREKIRTRKDGVTIREVIAWAIISGIGYLAAVPGLIIGFLWVIREKMEDVVCKCDMNGLCNSGNCLSQAA